MLKRIKKIKNLGIFSDYTWTPTLPPFKRYNIIYGWNGCGKTTLSNLFNIFEVGKSDNYPDLEYDIETESGNYKEATSYTRKIRVFNQDYVQKNVQMLSGTAKPIYILGEENKKLTDQIELDEKEYSVISSNVQKNKLDTDRKEKEKSKRFTDIARIISANTSGEATRQYDKRNAEDAFKKLSQKELINESEIDTHNLTLRQLEKPALNLVTVPKLRVNNDIYTLEEGFKIINQIISDLCGRTIESIAIDRLKDSADISDWVEEGIVIHSRHQSVICEFCNEKLSTNRLAELARHFNTADKQLKSQIEETLHDLKVVYSQIDNLQPIDKANLYEELQPSYQKLVNQFGVIKKGILDNLTTAESLLNEKKFKTTETLNFTSQIVVDELTRVITDLSGLLNKHNEKSADFKNEKMKAQKALERHYLSTIFDDIAELDTKIEKGKKDLSEYTIQMAVLIKRVTDNKSKISSSHKACRAINDGIQTFLGRDEITFNVEGDGYVIKRHGDVAYNLSEGEKTAIAFVYFTVHLQDQSFNISEGILVIDDPISSLDSNSLFQAFSFLKNSVIDAKQVFIFTHNFDFLKLLLNWLRYRVFKSQRNLYMINNSYLHDQRFASLQQLDKTLENHESEYHYLFSKLYRYVSDGQIETAYNIPNMSRKLMETFLMFRIPSNQGSYDKLELLKNPSNKNKLTAIQKFINDQSHLTGGGFDPSLIAETQNNVKYLLELIEESFPEHYSILVESINE